MIQSMDTYLETERLALRRFTADDADLLIELDSDPARPAARSTAGTGRRPGPWWLGAPSCR
ncbi:hypothetical protein [Streptacidiphilus albus]|uniref:hypothetical protein n=1 Tax=Streptacidiphilus albus TaxID=105425 RepID=UPI00054B7F94|nr:hypothetical protein [Streptacidiphilus albus]